MFVLEKIVIQKHEILGDCTIDFLDNRDSGYINYKTIIIGTNGSGKSTLLYLLTDIFINLDKMRNAVLDKVSKQKYRCDFELSYSVNNNRYVIDCRDEIIAIKKNDKPVMIENIELPSKIIVSTNTVSERFPLKYDRIRFFENHFDEYYQYFGTRSRRGQLVYGMHIRNAFEVFISRSNDTFYRRNIKRLLETLDFQSHIDIRYVIHKLTKYKQGFDEKISKKTARQIVEDAINGRSSYRTSELVRLGYFNDEVLKDKISKTLFEMIECSFRDRGINWRSELKFDLLGGHLELNGKTLNNEMEEFKVLQELGIIRLQDLILYKNGKAVNYREASSGELQQLATFMALLGVVEDDALVLIDEPEISLHPEWQTRLVDNLDQILSKFRGLHYLVVTHSPFIISDVKSDEANILRMEKKNGKILVRQYKGETYGLSVEEIILNTFNMATSRNYYLNDKVGKIFQSLKDHKGIWTSSDRSNIDELLDLTKKLNTSDPIYLLVQKISKAIDGQKQN
ncbi:AAA family ATPase [Pseudobdellovibrio exovorus]|uniref:Endonuclease GajA/Old nuclease/RecF-like AAA domain-containing protein n=1 Tax=Pseudobdellovibrio exovorus JSS TaxID=1184267 RepID=M4VDR9_9BACT|nr:ATP-binding protein [Pseudobdellovibrio exovorus]AGH96635.1 hypothetical protein A11Q_2419 [Pseudobdellovibrio exovorus JSS]